MYIKSALCMHIMYGFMVHAYVHLYMYTWACHILYMYVYSTCWLVPLLYLQQAAIVSQVNSFIDMHQVICAGPFVYAYVDEVCLIPQKINKFFI